MWAQFEQGELTADSKLTGVFAHDDIVADSEALLLGVEDAREAALKSDCPHLPPCLTRLLFEIPSATAHPRDLGRLKKQAIMRRI